MALAEGVGESRDAAWNVAVTAFASDDFTSAAKAAFTVLDGMSRDDKRYDRAIRLLALSAEALGLRYPASLWFLDIAESKREPELVPDALRGLERIVMGGPHDADTVVAGVSRLRGAPQPAARDPALHRLPAGPRQRAPRAEHLGRRPLRPPAEDQPLLRPRRLRRGGSARGSAQAARGGRRLRGAAGPGAAAPPTWPPTPGAASRGSPSRRAATTTPSPATRRSATRPQRIPR
jgi:hypothetical protein